MELKQAINIAHAHLNGEGKSLEDVIQAFETFIEANTPLYKKDLVYV